jgi:hypothetical protein
VLLAGCDHGGDEPFGNARILQPGHADFEHFWSVVRWQSDHVERSRDLDDPPLGHIAVIPADRIVYTEHWLRREGYAPRQSWHRSKTKG